MYFSAERADGQFIVPVLDPQVYADWEDIINGLSELGLGAVVRGQEKSPSYSQVPENVFHMFANDDCTPVYGTWMLPEPSASAHEMREACVKEIRRIHGFRIKHVGINGDGTADSARKLAAAFSGLFGFPSRETKVSVFSNEEIELMFSGRRDDKGHLCVGSRNVRRSACMLGLMGVELDWDTAVYGDKGLNLIYLKERFGGFSVHLGRI